MMFHPLLIGLVLLGQSPGSGSRTAPPTPVDDTEVDHLEQPRKDREKAGRRLDGGGSEDSTPDVAGPQVPVKVQPPRIAPPALLASALQVPAEGALPGSPLALSQVLSTAGRGRQLDAARIYWRLSEAVAEYHFALDEYLRISRYGPPDPDADREAIAEGDRWQIEEQAAAARTQEAELAAVAAQHELASFLVRSANDPLPLPLDLPHVGGFRTRFDQIFASRAAPPRLRLIDRTLPIRRTAIDVRAAAVIAAEDAFQAAEDAYAARQTGLAIVADRLADLGRQRQAFLAAVRRYNDEIAEYVVVAAGENATSQGLAAMLIIPRPTTPTEANRRPVTDPPALDDAPPPANESEAEASPPADPFAPETPARPDRRPGAADARDAWDALAAADTAGVTPADAGLYTVLVDLPPVKQAHRLAEVLHWDRSLPANVGQPISLDDCLKQTPLSGRSVVIAAFWQAREQAARYQALAELGQQLSALTPLVVDRWESPEGPRAMLDLQAARRSAEADLMESHADLLVALMELTRVSGRPLEGAWLLPATVPHAGRYQLYPETAGGGASRTRALRQAAVEVPKRHASLAHLATAVVLADSVRVQAVDDYQFGRRSMDDLLDTVDLQSRETLAFLGTLTRYNQSIAQYAAAALPAEMAADQFVSALVVRKSTSP